MTSSCPPPAPANRDRAVEALEHAIIAAESGTNLVEVPELRRDDFALLPTEELRPRLDRILVGPTPEAGLDVLLHVGFLDACLPEIKALVGFGDGEWRHKDVWKHTKQVIAQSVPRLEVRWAALFHDIGKVKTRSISPEGEVHFLGHAEVGARQFDKLERRLRWFSKDRSLRDSVHFLILNHLRASQYDGSWTDSAVRRFAKEVGGELDNLLCLSRADITTKRPEKRRKVISYIDELAERVAVITAQDAIVPPLPTGVGNEIMTVFKIPPSRLIGEIKRALETAVDSGEIESHRESSYYVEFVAANRERFGIKKADLG
jgi:poly(A) polymerase